MSPGVRGRALLALGCGLLAWFAWAEARRAGGELAARREADAQSAGQMAAAARERERAELLGRVLERVARRAPPPESAAAVREAFLRAADAEGVEFASFRLQPIARPPAGAVGAEARITLLGDPPALSRFLASLGERGWPLRTDRATLAVRGGLGTLTATVLVLWPDPAAATAEADALRLAGDPRLGRLADWLAAVPEPSAEPSRAASSRPPEPTPDPAPTARAATDGFPGEEPGEGDPLAPPPAAPPELHGFVEVEPGAPVRAALHYRGETTLAALGDRIGEYTVVGIEPAAAVVLSRADGPPLRLVLR